METQQFQLPELLPAVLQDRGARDILAAFERVGEDSRLVGGCVRDALVGVNAEDIDIATTALPERAADILSAAGFKIKPVGMGHGVVLAIRDGKKYEVATLREDVKTDGRHAMVAFTRDWALDAARRDFTINALSMDKAGQVYDSVGGYEDLKAGRVRFIGDANARISEDYLRILRFYRFHTRFGKEWDMAARAACRKHADGLKKLSPERITDEIKKLLSLQNPWAGCAAISDDKIIPSLSDTRLLKQLLAREKIYGVQPWHVRLSAWLNLKMDETFILPRAIQNEMQSFAAVNFSNLLHALYHEGKSVVQGVVMLRAAENELPNLMKEIQNFNQPEFPLHGEDLLQIGVQPGPQLGDILRQTEEWWLDNHAVSDAATCLEYAKSLLK